MATKKDNIIEFLKTLGLIVTGGLISFYIEHQYSSRKFEELLNLDSIGDITGKAFLIIIIIAVVFTGTYLFSKFLMTLVIILISILLEPFSILSMFLKNTVLKKPSNFFTKRLKKYITNQQKENKKSHKEMKFLSKHYYPNKEIYNFIISFGIYVLAIIGLKSFWLKWGTIKTYVFIVILFLYLIFGCWRFIRTSKQLN